MRFGQISGTEIEAGVRIVIPRHQLQNLVTAENLLLRRRLKVRFKLQPNGDMESQQYLYFEDRKVELATIVDTSDMTVGQGWLATRITFACDELKAKDILRLSKKEGTMALDEIASQDGDDD